MSPVDDDAFLLGSSTEASDQAAFAARVSPDLQRVEALPPPERPLLENPQTAWLIPKKAAERLGLRREEVEEQEEAEEPEPSPSRRRQGGVVKASGGRQPAATGDDEDLSPIVRARLKRLEAQKQGATGKRQSIECQTEAAWEAKSGSCAAAEQLKDSVFIVDCDRCALLEGKLNSVSQALAGLAARVFNWSLGMPLAEEDRHALAAVVLEYLRPCVGIDARIAEAKDRVETAAQLDALLEAADDADTCETIAEDEEADKEEDEDEAQDDCPEEAQEEEEEEEGREAAGRGWERQNYKTDDY
eukprot:TRINITY_DN44612_c0_g1_i1.p1 TRINITY_DN44612_c0_g1~~TRINITY_DN44612_c0_g1_i1.p1  ORF type:complete len:302 (+),score=114.65 TRINITY_DN44612_c0_g1_i1:71-976(+)